MFDLRPKLPDALLMRQEEISFAFAQGPASLKMDSAAQAMGVFGPAGIPGPVLDNCLTVSTMREVRSTKYEVRSPRLVRARSAQTTSVSTSLQLTNIEYDSETKISTKI